MRLCISLFTMLAVIPSLACAQVFKCKSSSGTIEYSQTPCANQVRPALPIRTAPAPESDFAAPSQASAGNSYDRQLRAKIAEAIAAKDYRKASQLAVTEDHHRMVSDAQRVALAEKRALEAERRARRPVICTRKGHISSGGSYLDTTICQ